MGAGMHGSNGLPANVSIQLFLKIYPLPRLMFGLETLMTNVTTANEAIYLMPVILTIKPRSSH